MNTLENDIKQTTFTNSKQKSFLNILYTANWLRDQTAPYFKEYGILQQHYNVLRIVKGKKGEPASPGQIIAVMLDKGRDLTRLVDKLVKFGYLRRSTSEINRRKVEIFITDEGNKVVELVDEKLVKFYQTLGIEESEAEALNSFLDKIRN